MRSTWERVRVRLPLVVGLGLVLALVGACGGQADPGPETSRTGPTGATDPTETAATGATASGATGSALESRIEATLEIEYPDRILIGSGSVWIHTDDQRELRIDPTTNEVVAEILLGGGFCQGSGIGEGRVWACGENLLLGIDPRTNEVDLETGIEMQADQWAIGVGEGAVWILEGGGLGDRLLRVNAETGEAGKPIQLGRDCANTAVGFGSVWISCQAEGVVVVVDAERERVTEEIPVEGVLEIEAGPDAMWAGSTDPAGGVARIDPKTHEVSFVHSTTGPGDTGAIWVDGSDVWVRSSTVYLTRIDANTLTVAEELPSSEPLGGGAVAVGFGSVWASSYDFFQVVRIRP